MTLPPIEARSALLSLLQDQAVSYGDFVLSSGKRSTYYLDARLVTLSSRGSGLVGTVLFEALSALDVEAVAGLTLGADPIVTAIAVVSGLAGRPIDALIVRKERKEHGAGRRIEGPWRPGIRVAIVDDTLTTGASSLDAATAVQEAGGVVVGVWALIDRNQGAREAIEGSGYPFHPIFDASEVVRTPTTS